MTTPFTPQCIITGCDLYFRDSNKRAHGDLWVLGECYIFNAVLKGGETMLLDADGLADKFVELEYFSNAYFERRGVIVFHREADATLSPAAQRYLDVWAEAV